MVRALDYNARGRGFESRSGQSPVRLEAVVVPLLYRLDLRHRPFMSGLSIVIRGGIGMSCYIFLKSKSQIKAKV